MHVIITGNFARISKEEGSILSYKKSYNINPQNKKALLFSTGCEQVTYHLNVYSFRQPVLLGGVARCCELTAGVSRDR